MNTLRLVVSVALLATLLTFSALASATNSPDGSSLVPGGTGSLVNSAGTWSFSTSTGAGGNLILLNGSNSAADGGSAIEMIVGNGGNLYQLNNAGNWYEWNGGPYWTHLGANTPFAISALGSSMVPGGSVDLVTAQGIWAFSASTGAGGNLVLLNGASASGGSGVSLLAQNGQMYQKNNAGNWYVWSVANSYWNPTTDPTAAFSTQCASAVVVGLKWSAVSGASTYNITRNGAGIETGTSQLVYTDQGVGPQTAYTYVLSAMNGSTTVSTQTLKITTPAATPDGDPAYCPSTVIAGITWNWSTGINQQNKSDLWSATLDTQGTTYLFWGDGPGFFGSLANGDTDKASFAIGQLTLSAPAAGTAPNLTASNALNIYGGPNAQHLATLSGKANSIIAINTSGSTTNYYALGGVWQPGDGKTASEPYQIYGGPNHQEIVYSNGNPYTWESNFSNWIFCADGSPAIADTNHLGFCPISFVNLDAGNKSSDGYTYLLGATNENFIGNGGSCACTFIGRVPSGSLLTENAYQVFNGFSASGGAQWTAWVPSSSATDPIFVDNGSRPIGLGKVVYNAGLNRYIGIGQGNYVNQFAVYDAPNAWGPWTTVAYTNSATNNTGGWGNLGTTSFSNANSIGDSLGVNFMNGWTSSNGLTMWATFSSDGDASSSADLVQLQGLTMDSLSLVSATLSLY